jgi:hypothetical protein
LLSDLPLSRAWSIAWRCVVVVAIAMCIFDAIQASASGRNRPGSRASQDTAGHPWSSVFLIVALLSLGALLFVADPQVRMILDTTLALFILSYVMLNRVSGHRLRLSFVFLLLALFFTVVGSSNLNGLPWLRTLARVTNLSVWLGVLAAVSWAVFLRTLISRHHSNSD